MAIGNIEPRKTGESEKSAEIRIKGQAAENAIMNDFIQENIIIEFEPSNVVNTRYMTAKENEKEMFNKLAFTIIKDEYESELKQYPRIQGIEFQNYVKLFNNKRISPDLRNTLESSEVAQKLADVDVESLMQRPAPATEQESLLQKGI